MQLGQRCQEKNLEKENQPRDSHAPLSRVHAQPLRSWETSKWVTSQWHGMEWVFLTAANCWCRKTGLAKESLKPGRLCPGPSSGIHRAKRRSGIFPSHLLFPPKSEDIALFSLSFMYIRSHVHSQPWVSVGLFVGWGRSSLDGKNVQISQQLPSPSESLHIIISSLGVLLLSIFLFFYWGGDSSTDAQLQILLIY